MRRAVLPFAVLFVFASPAAFAQEPPPPLPHVVVDMHGLVPVFPNDAQQLADSRGLASVTELPGAGLGGKVGVHLYFFKWKAVTVGVGGEALVGHSSSTPESPALTLLDGTMIPLVAVDERLTSADGQLSLNFGTGHGWSYLSGGVGRSHWSVHPAGQPETAADRESLPTINYGGGARWFAKKHLAFSLDVRVYEIQPGTATATAPGSPRTRLFVVGAGISLK